MQPQQDPYLTSDDKARKARIAAAWAAYNDDFPKPLKIEEKEDDDNIINNRCASIVDTGVTFLFGNKLEIQIKETQSATDNPGDDSNPMQDALDSTWGEMDERMTFLTKLGMNGGVAGHVFVKVIPPDQTGTGLPRLINLDPACMTIQTMPDDCDMVMSYSHEYSEMGSDGQEVRHREVTAFTDAGTWEITQFVQRGGGQWTQVGEVIDWPFAWSPIHSAQNLPMPNRAWGKEDITPGIIGQNKQLNFVQSNTNRILHKHAHPWPWASGVEADKIKTAPGRVICLPVPDAQMGLLETNGAGLQASREFAADLRGDMDEQSGVPAVAVGRISEIIRGNVSGIAIKLMFAPLLAKTEKKRRLYGDLIADLCSHILELLGYGPDIKVELHWEDALPEDVLPEVQAAVLLEQLGVSKATLLARLGFNPDEEAEKSRQEAQDAMLNFQQGAGMAPQPNMPMTDKPPQVPAPQSALAGQQQPVGAGAQ